MLDKKNSNNLEVKTNLIKEINELFKNFETSMNNSNETKKKNDAKNLNSVNPIISFVNKNKNNLAFVPQLKEYDHTLTQMIQDFDNLKDFDFETEVNALENMLDQNDIQIEKVKNLLVNNLSDYLRS